MLPLGQVGLPREAGASIRPGVKGLENKRRGARGSAPDSNRSLGNVQAASFSSGIERLPGVNGTTSAGRLIGASVRL